MKAELIAVVKQLRELMQQQDAYLDTIPTEFQELVQDNGYANLQGLQIDVLIKAVFGSGEMYEDIMWFFYEFTPGKTPGPHIIVNGTEYCLLTDDDYYTYLRYQEP